MPRTGDSRGLRRTDVRFVSIFRRLRGPIPPEATSGKGPFGPPAPPWAIAAVVGLALTGLHALLGGEIADAILYEAVGLCAVIAALVGARRQRGARARPWYLLAFGLLLWISGDVFWNVQGLMLETEPFPSTADALYLLGYPALGGAILLHVRQADRRGRFVGWIDTCLIAITVVLVMWLVLGIYSGGISSLGDAVVHAYSWGDLLIVAALARLLFVPGTRSTSFRLLITGLLLTLVADTFYYAPALQDVLSGEPLTTLFLLGYVAMGAAALHPSAGDFVRASETTSDPNAKRRLVVPAVSLLVGTAVVGVLAPAPSSGAGLWIATLGASTVAVLVVTRFVLLVRALEKLRVGADRMLELERTHNDRLRELDGLKDSFVANVSHELRTPLTSIRGYLELVLEGEAGDLNEEQRRFLSVVERNSDRLLRLVGDLLFVAQVDAGRIALERSPVDLEAIVEDAVESARPRAECDGLALILAARPVPTFAADGARLGQLLDNLVSNALKFTPPGGEVTVSCGMQGAEAFLEVRDTGIGIPAEEQDRLFERFFRASAASELAIQGTGLGLAVAKAISDGHDGTISVESAGGHGSTFRVTLPLALPPKTLGTPPAAVAT